MRGLVFDLSIPKYLLAKAVGKTVPAVHYGPGSCLSLRELPPPKPPPGTGWLRLKPIFTGLCGSDLATIFFKASTQLEPFNSFPAVLGHEILAEVVDVPEGVAGIEVGQRVAVNPMLPCRLRGLPLCHQCAQGLENGCEHTAEGCLAPGLFIGYNRDLPGGMAEEMLAHVSQLHPLPPEINDRAGVLVEPLSVALHAVLHHPPRQTDRVLIIGGGPVAFATLWALRAAGHRSHVTLLTVESYQLELARRFGADEVIRAAPDAVEAEFVAQRTGGKVYRPVIGPPVVEGGFELTIDCVGSAASLQDALRYTRAFGRIVLIGAAGVLKELDWTSVWRKEQTITGSYVYGIEEFRGKRQHTFDCVRDLIAAREGPDPAELVTHVFRLEEYRQAIEANVHRGQSRGIKTVFDPRGSHG